MAADKETFSERLADEIVGSCIMGSLDGHIDWINEELSTNFTEDDIDWDVVNNVTFECACCGWWCESHQLAGDGLCEECWEQENPEEDEEEDW